VLRPLVRAVANSMMVGSVMLFVACPGSAVRTDAQAERTDSPSSECSLIAGAPAEACGCDGACMAGARCIRDIVSTVTGSHPGGFAVCTSTDAGLCVCGVWLDDRCQGGAGCVCPGADDNGLCLTPEQKATLCAGPLAKSFNCSFTPSVDAAPGIVP
jgi:hypothetical protein